MRLTAESRKSRCSLVRGLRLGFEGPSAVDGVALFLGVEEINLRRLLTGTNAGARNSCTGGWPLWRSMRKEWREESIANCIHKSSLSEQLDGKQISESVIPNIGSNKLHKYTVPKQWN